MNLARALKLLWLQTLGSPDCAHLRARRKKHGVPIEIDPSMPTKAATLIESN